jgi:hypothetical protein
MKPILGFILLGSISLFGFEVNTHQAITRCAITPYVPQCSTEGTKNLDDFVSHAGLKNENYTKEKFLDYGKTYKKYAETGTGFEKWKIKVDSDYRGMVEAGVILEDSVYHNHDNDGDGRFNNHFYAAQFNSRAECTNKNRFARGETTDLGIFLPSFANPADMLSSKALCLGYRKRTDNITWALDDSVNLGDGRVNHYDIYDTFEYFRKSFYGSSDNRKKYQAKLFVSLGFMIHMIQDLHSPAHVRDGSHGAGDYLEEEGVRHFFGIKPKHTLIINSTSLPLNLHF